MNIGNIIAIILVLILLFFIFTPRSPTTMKFIPANEPRRRYRRHHHHGSRHHHHGSRHHYHREFFNTKHDPVMGKFAFVKNQS